MGGAAAKGRSVLWTVVARSASRVHVRQERHHVPIDRSSL